MCQKTKHEYKAPIYAMYLRVRLPRQPSRLQASGPSKRERGRFHALLLDHGRWTSRGPSSVATVADQTEAVEAICEGAQLAGRLRNGENLLVVTQGTSGSGKTHLLLGGAPHRVTDVHDAVSTGNGLADPPSSIRVEVGLSVAQPRRSHAFSGLDVRDSDFGVLQRCLCDLLGGQSIDTVSPTGCVDVSLSAACFTTVGWTDVLAETVDTCCLSNFEDASQRRVSDLTGAHLLIHTALTRCADVYARADSRVGCGHLVFCVSVLAPATPGLSGKALFVDMAAPPSVTTFAARPLADNFYAHTEFVARGALLGTLEDCRAVATGWLTPWESLFRRFTTSVHHVVVLVAVPPSTEMTPHDLAVLRFGETLRQMRNRQVALPSAASESSQSTTSRALQTSPLTRRRLTRLVPLDAGTLSQEVSANVNSAHTVSSSSVDTGRPGDPMAYRRLPCLPKAEAVPRTVSPPRREQSEAPQTTGHLSALLKTALSRSSQDALDALTPTSSSMTSKVTSAHTRSHPPRKARWSVDSGSAGRRSCATASNSRRRRVPSARRPNTARVMGPRAAAHASAATRALARIEAGEDKCRRLLEQREHRARTLVLSGFCIPRHRGTPPALGNAPFVPITAHSVLSSSSASVSLSASPMVCLPDVGSVPACTPLQSLTSSLSAGGSAAWRKMSLALSPYSPLARIDRRATNEGLKQRQEDHITDYDMHSPSLHVTHDSWPSHGILSPVNSAGAQTSPQRTHNDGTAGDSTRRRQTWCPPISPPSSASPKRRVSLRSMPSGRWRSSVFIDGGLELEDLKSSVSHRRSCVSFPDVDRILPVVVEVHREITAQDHLMAAELMARSEIELKEEQRRSALEQKQYSATKSGGGTPAKNMKRSAVPSPSRRFFFA